MTSLCTLTLLEQIATAFKPFSTSVYDKFELLHLRTLNYVFVLLWFIFVFLYSGELYCYLRYMLLLQIFLYETLCNLRRRIEYWMNSSWSYWSNWEIILLMFFQITVNFVRKFVSLEWTIPEILIGYIFSRKETEALSR